ncbi:hypothetical protein C8J23_15124, partial [Shewanella chilikensis]
MQLSEALARALMLFGMCLSEVPRPGMKEQSILIGVGLTSM